MIKRDSDFTATFRPVAEPHSTKGVDFQGVYRHPFAGKLHYIAR